MKDSILSELRIINNDLKDVCETVYDLENKIFEIEEALASIESEVDWIDNYISTANRISREIHRHDGNMDINDRAL